MRKTAALFVALIAVASMAPAADPVSVREEKLGVPTWEIGPPSPHPVNPGPQGRIYPYTLNDELTDRKVDRIYDAVFLENEYVKVLILPEIGGRLHGAVDKTNDYVWLYWQRTIKPGLIRAADRLALLEDHRETVERRGDLTKRWIDLLLGRGTPDLRAHVLWKQAGAREGEERAALLQAILEEDHPRPSLGTHYQALALKALGRTDEAGALLERLEASARTAASEETRPNDRAAAHYLVSLVMRERGDAAGAEAEMRKATELDPRPERRALTQAQIEYAVARQ